MKIRNLVAIAFVVLFLVVCHPAAYADSFRFSTLPGTGDVAGPAGSTVAWGYSISNQSLTNWLVTTAINAGNPFAGGSLIGSARDKAASYTATVSPTSLSAPSTLLLMVVGLAVLCLKRTNSGPV